MSRSASPSASPSTPPSRGRRVAFYAIALLFPFLLLAAAEGILRLTWKSASLPLFVPMRLETGDAFVANRAVARRWFASENDPPVPIPEPFAVDKPANALRIFVLGESTTAGFPYPHNGTFSRVIRDALRDVLPSDSVEVINLGIPATNSFAMLDMANEIIAQHPDAVLIYAGHNEYYGALGAASTEAAFSGSPSLVRAYLALQRLRLVYAMRTLVVKLRRHGKSAGNADQAVSFMETLANDKGIPLGSAEYRRGVSQLTENLDRLLGRFADAHVPVFIGSVTSNVRDQAPLSAPHNPADSVYAAARAALAKGDSGAARTLFVRARDLDIIRFRAPSEFNDVIRAAAKQHGAVYVPVSEAFDSAGAGMPGSALFLEHVHPTQDGTLLIARTFFDAIRANGFVGRTAQLARLRTWPDYERGMDLTPFDLRIAFHTRATLAERWPFVPLSEQRDYRRTYHPAGTLDSLAFYVSRGGPWVPTKLQMAHVYDAAGQADSAVAEYRGLVRENPEFAEPWGLLGGALVRAKADSEAAVAFGRSLAIRPSGAVALEAAELEMRHRNFAAAIPLFEQAVRSGAGGPRALYELSLAFGSNHDLPRARATAAQLARIAPNFPGLSDWMRTLGSTR